MLSCDSCTVSLGVEEYWARGAAGLGWAGLGWAGLGWAGEIQMLGCTFSPPVL